MKTRHLIILASIIFLPLLAYGMARFLVNVLSLQPGLGEIVAISLMVFMVLLIAPYLMLKSTFHNAKVEDKKENELHLKDLPKDAAETKITYPQKH